ncbi:SRPBCC family protein [Gulosibacter faecalis]|jgi:uncharacterized protein YndB with AHSA1/START domain|uniref:SRPBCC family protein n=1 Tax=Gulosibacter faecalis TaxID=272240 RepID=A0ABW5UWL2_9MICO|nr:SRPBCC family protein [Gulosibacter faecalis]
MTDTTESRIVTASDDINAAAETVFELIADPSRQPEWDGNDNLASAAEGQRVLTVGDVFNMNLTNGESRENHVIDFAEGTTIAWKPAPTGEEARGHVWRWDVEATGDATCHVTHTYDWTQLTDETRFPRARATGEAQLAASVARLKALAESL